MITLEDALGNVLMGLFENRQMAIRRIIVERLKERYGTLGYTNLDSAVAKRLNLLVDHGVLQRVTQQPGVRMYAPGARYCRAVPKKHL